jgi:cytochrome P450
MGEIAALCPPNCHPQIYYTAIARKYNLPGIFYIDLWPVGPPSAIVTDPDLLEQITVTKVLQMHQMAEDFMSPIVGSGVVATANGPVWKSLHRAMSPAFSWSHIRSLTDLIVDECAIFRTNLDKRVKTGELFSLEDLSAKLIFDVIARVVFNFPLNAQTTNSQHLQDLHELVALVEGQADITVAYNPVEQFRRWRRRSALSKRLDPFIIGKIQERFDLLVKEQIVPSRKNPTSILDLMLRDHLQAVDGKAQASKTPTLSKDDMALLLTK